MQYYALLYFCFIFANSHISFTQQKGSPLLGSGKNHPLLSPSFAVEEAVENELPTHSFPVDLLNLRL